jgi:hypothetical protein
MSPAVTISSTSGRTMVRTPPRLMPGRLVFVDHLDRDEEVDLRGPAQAHEIDMRGQVLDHVALHVAADHADVVLTFDLEVEQRRQEPAVLQALQQDVEGDLDRQRVAPPPYTIPGTLPSRRA